MKKLLVTLCMVIVVCTLVACGDNPKIAECESLIDSIGYPNISENSENAIVSAERSFNSLSKEDQDKVKNQSVMQASRIRLDEIKADAKVDGAVATALAKAIKDGYHIKDGEKLTYIGKFNRKISPKDCKLNIQSKNKSGTGWEVYGTVSFYDEFGQLVPEFNDGSGDYRIGFAVFVSGDYEGTVKVLY